LYKHDNTSVCFFSNFYYDYIKTSKPGFKYTYFFTWSRTKGPMDIRPHALFDRGGHKFPSNFEKVDILFLRAVPGKRASGVELKSIKIRWVEVFPGISIWTVP